MAQKSIVFTLSLQQNVEQQKLIKRCINEMSSVLLDNLYGYWRGDLSDYLKDRGNLKYFMRGYEMMPIIA